MRRKPRDDVAANDHRLDVGGTRSEDHDGDPIAEPVEVRGSHVDDRDIGLFAWREGADLAATAQPGAGRRPAVPVVKVIEPPGRRCGPAACTAASAPKYRRAKNSLALSRSWAAMSRMTIR